MALSGYFNMYFLPGFSFCRETDSVSAVRQKGGIFLDHCNLRRHHADRHDERKRGFFHFKIIGIEPPTRSAMKNMYTKLPLQTIRANCSQYL